MICVIIAVARECRRDSEMMNGFENAQKFGRESVDRSVESLGAVQRGMQVLATETADFSKQALEDGAAHVEKLLGVTSLNGAVETQSEFVRASMEKAMGQAQRFGELYMGLMKDAVRPFEAMMPNSGK